jgi:hypothetical protein
LIKLGTKKDHIVEMFILLGELCPIIFQRVTAPRLCIFFEKYFSLQLLLNHFGDIDETWHKERSHCGHVHIVREALFNYFSRSYGLWTWQII